MSKVIITNEQKEVKIPTGVKMLVRRLLRAVLAKAHAKKRISMR